MKRFIILSTILFYFWQVNCQNVLVYCGSSNCLQLFSNVEEQASECSGGIAEIFTTTEMPTVADVENMDIIIFERPQAFFSSAVVDEIVNRLSEQAVLFVIGEHVNCCIEENERIDDLLSQIGSTMSNQNTLCSSGCHDPGLPIVDDNSCVVQGVSSLTGSGTSNINEGGGTILMTACGEPTFVEEFVNGGTIYYLGDGTVLYCDTTIDIVLQNMICNCSSPCQVGVYAPTDSIFLCQGEASFILNIDTFSIDPPASISWTATNGGEDYLDQDNIEDPLVTLPSNFEGVITYFVQIQGNSEDCIDVDSIVVVVHPNPDPIIEGYDSICINETAYFLIVDPEGGEWGGAADEDGFIDPSSLGVGTHLVTYSYFSDDNCQGEAQVDIVIYDTAIIVIEPVDNPLCISSGEIELKATPEGGVWDDLVVGTVFNPEDAGIGAVELSYTYTTENGCATSQTIQFIIIPEFISEIIGPDSLCITDAVVQYEGILGNGEWGGVANVVGEVDPFELGIGTHEITYSSPPGECSIPDTLFVGVFEHPYASIDSLVTICNNGEETVINFDDLIVEGDEDGNWLDVDNTGALGEFPNLDFEGVEPDDYIFEYTTNSALASCLDQTYELIVSVQDCSCPSLALENPEILCHIDVNYDLELIKITNEEGIFTIVNYPDGNNPAEIISNIIQGADVDAGIYTIQFDLANPVEECPDSVVVTLTIIAGPEAGQGVDEFAVCEGEQGTTSLFDLIENNDAGGTWTQISGQDVENALNENSGGLDYGNIPIGIYGFRYTVEGEGPCGDAEVEINIEIYANPIADAGLDMNLECSAPQVELGGASSQGGEYQYSWEGPSGSLGDAITQMASEAGVYTITVINTETGCSAEDEVVLGTQGEIITSAMIEAEGIGCEAEADGVIRILEVEGGIGPYMYSLNGANFTDQNQWTGLEAGEYEILIEDEVGCQYLIVTEVEDRIPLELSIGGMELELGYGEEMNLTALLNIAEDEIAEIIWRSGGVELCNGCTSITIVGTEAGTITVEVTDMFGCTIEASFTYTVFVNENVYIPSVFSPNGDGLNDEFYVYGGGSTVQVVYMRIYTRWGELVYEASNLSLTDPEFGWDGTFKGEVLNPNVFSYEMEVSFESGRKRFYTGDLTLLR